MSNPQILVIVGTTREGRLGRTIADWYLAEARKAAPHLDFSLLDTRDLNLPLFDLPTPPLFHHYDERQKGLAKSIEAADAYVFVTGEYNHSIPGSLKNLLDYLNPEWSHKVAGFVGYGAAGAIRSIEHLIQVLNYLNVAALKDHLLIDTVWQALDEQGVPKPGHLHGDLKAHVAQLAWWAEALREARKRSPPPQVTH